MGYEDQINFYAYVGNDPLNATDPSGMSGYFGQAFTGNYSGWMAQYHRNHADPKAIAEA